MCPGNARNRFGFAFVLRFIPKLVYIDVHAQVFQEKVPAFGRVVAHIEFQSFGNALVLAHQDRVEPHLRADEDLELVRRDFPKPFEAGDFRLAAQLLDGIEAFFLSIAVKGFLLVADPEKRGLEDIEMAALDDVREIAEEEGEQECPDMHPVHIGIGGNHDVVVPQVLDVLGGVERGLQEVEFFVLVHEALALAVAVVGFPPQAENGLGIGIAALGNAARCRIPLGDEKGAFESFVVVGVVVDAAVAELAVVQVHFLGAFPAQFLDIGHAFALFLAFDDLSLHGFGYIPIDMQKIVNVLFDRVMDVVAYRFPVVSGPYRPNLTWSWSGFRTRVL